VHFSDYDPYTDAVMRDPWPFYAALRRDSPVHYLEQYDTWFLSRFEDIWQATTQDMFTAERGVTPEMILLKRPPAEDPVFSRNGPLGPYLPERLVSAVRKTQLVFPIH
jgi:cytochrome P450